MEQKHTALPWTTDTDDLGTWINHIDFFQPIAKMGKCTNYNAQANAEFIVRAVNSHYELIEALEATKNQLAYDYETLKQKLYCVDKGDIPSIESGLKSIGKTLKKAEAALKKAEAK